MVCMVIKYVSALILGVHLECPAGKYGRNCLKNCSENCYISKTCNRKNGVCQTGCVKGWKLPLCNEGTILCLIVNLLYVDCLWVFFYFFYYSTFLNCN